MLEELGMIGIIIVEVINLCVLYFVIKWGVKNGIKDYYYEKEEEEAEVKERNKKGEK